LKGEPLALDTSTTFGKAVLCARLAQDKQAQDILILDMTEIEGAPADFFVIASVASDAQMQAVTNAVSRSMKELGLGSARLEGGRESPWTILDYFDIVVHVMMVDTRDFYRLEHLWGDARAFGLTNEGAPHELSTVPRRSASS